jgi:hypothetical protein
VIVFSVAQAKAFLGVRAVLPNDKHTLPAIAGFKKTRERENRTSDREKASQLILIQLL